MMWKQYTLFLIENALENGQFEPIVVGSDGIWARRGWYGSVQVHMLLSFSLIPFLSFLKSLDLLVFENKAKMSLSSKSLVFYLLSKARAYIGGE